MRRKIGGVGEISSIRALTLAVSSAETRRAEGTATALAVLCSTAELCRCSRLCFSGLTRGQKRQYSRDGNQSQNVPPQMANVLRIGNRLNRHDPPVHDTRPHREPDEASVRQWITRRNNQEHAERCIDTEDHFEIFRATCCVPSPARRPEDGERPYTEDEDKPYDHQDDA